MNVQGVFDHINAEAIACDTLEFVKVRSETGQEGEGSRFLADLLRREGFDVTLDEVEPHRPNVYALVPGAPTPPLPHSSTLLFNGHTDTIPIGRSDPPGREGDWVIGRGAEDMKGGLVAMVHAASALRKAGVRLAGDLWLTGVIGHETPVGKKEGPRRLIQHLRAGAGREETLPVTRHPSPVTFPSADAILIVEGPCAIWAASLGSTIFNVTITSERGAIHTSKVPYADNPACWLGRLLMEFERMEERFLAAPHHPRCGRGRLNVGIVRGGDFQNRLPTPLTVTGTRRWTPGQTCADVRAELQGVCDRLAAESGLTFTLSLEGAREPFETPGDHPLVRALQTAGQAVAGRTPDVIGLALVGDANLYVHEAGVPTVYYGPAYDTAHSDHERVSVAQLAHCAKVYARAAMEFCGVVEP
jgi:acetylornithine deacetylase/succinyl-diaminopimelate desuccinylase-like protein